MPFISDKDIQKATGKISDEQETKPGFIGAGKIEAPQPKSIFAKASQGLGQRFGETFKRRGSQFKDIFGRVTTAQESKALGVVPQTIGQNPLSTAVQALGTAVGTGSDLAFDIIAEFTPQTIKDSLGDALEATLRSPVGQKILVAADEYEQFAKKHPQAAADLAGTVELASLLPIGKAGQVTTKGIGKGVDVAGRGIERVGEAAQATTRTVKGAVEDVVPSPQRIVSQQVTRALDLTQGDARNILNSTGNEVGEFVARNNLIRDSKGETIEAVQDFFQQNFDEVRANITKVDKTYNVNNVPRFKQALENIKKEVADVPGLESDNEIVDTLLKKKEITLEDVQQVKELVDEHFSLFKITGDPASGRQKQGVRNMRADLREFIENEVEEVLDIDIFDLNNNVSTSKGILQASAARSTRGLTRSNIQLGDLAAFGVGTAAGGGNFLVGVAAVLGKKILASPAIKLRFARWVDKLSDAKKAKVAQDLTEGRIPEELPESIKDVLEEDL